MAGRLKRAAFRLNLGVAAVATHPQVVDFSSTRLDPVALRAAGFAGAARYQWIEAGQRPQFNRDKAITRAEYDALRGAGLAVALICQVDKDNYLRGYPEGLRHGALSLQHSRSMGHPDSCPILLAVQDQSIPVSNYNLTVDYMHGFMDGRGMGPQLVYGGTNVGNLCVNAGYAKGIWQAAASSWSTVPSASVVMKQLVSKSYPQFPPLSYDENDILAANWGQNPGPGATCIFGYPCPWHH